MPAARRQTRFLFLRFSLEFVVIILGVMVSLHFQGLRDAEVASEMKDQTLQQLIRVISDDLQQIDKFIVLQETSLDHANRLELVMKGESLLEEDSCLYSLSHVGRALRSFFPQQGTFNQLVSSDLVKVIDSPELKTRLFKLYNEDLLRHDVHTKEYDQFFLRFNYDLTRNFFLEDSWDLNSAPVTVHEYAFNSAYFFSDGLRADLIEARSSMRNYIRELMYLESEFEALRQLCAEEVSMPLDSLGLSSSP